MFTTATLNAVSVSGALATGYVSTLLPRSPMGFSMASLIGKTQSLSSGVVAVQKKLEAALNRE